MSNKLKTQKRITVGSFTPHNEEAIEYGEPIKFFHYIKDGVLQYQGFIDEVRKGGGGSAILFDFVMGDMSARINFTKDFLKDCILYDSDYDMNMAYKELK